MQESLGFQMIQEQTQKLIMNQEMRQAITILQFSSLELASYIEKQLESNPAFDLDRVDLRKKHKYTSSSTSNPIEHLSRNQVSLEQNLLEQLSYQKLSTRKRKIGRYIIGLIDHDGYFREDIDHIASELNCNSTEIDEVLSIIQTFEPIGVGARNLSECLWIQLRAKGYDSPMIERILVDHLQALADRKFSNLAELYGVSEKEIMAIMDQVEMVNPRPGMLLEPGEVKYLAPDIIVEWNDGEFKLVLNERIYPNLQIDPSYHQYLKFAGNDGDSKSYIQEHLRHALWIIRSIEQRKATILKVTEAIFQHQKDFLVHGFEALRPLTLQEVATEIGMHESTVSRASNQKYVQTTKGLYELKQFFVHGISTASGVPTTPYPIKKRIGELIEAEDKASPLSDQQITIQLNLEGIQISRRTVMKYREELQIPASSKRRSRA